MHVLTVNDYLAKRDAEWMGPLFKFLGLTVGVIQHNLEPAARRAAYAADITYVTNSGGWSFDYLRDNMAWRVEDMVQRELYYAIVDEVDSILIDEARTPLIISGQGSDATDLYAKLRKAHSSLLKKKKTSRSMKRPMRYRSRRRASRPSRASAQDREPLDQP